MEISIVIGSCLGDCHFGPPRAEKLIVIPVIQGLLINNISNLKRRVFISNFQIQHLMRTGTLFLIIGGCAALAIGGILSTLLYYRILSW
ncbi:MAG TPA: hypothetical protein VJM74_05525 [Nitrososphaeraceae archaeon]|nr:hypothetical protein [Nitrososphaeraceae archaeon]